MAQLHRLESKSKEILVILTIVLICFIGIAIFFSHEETANVVVKKIELQQEIYGSNNSVNTYNYYSIYTTNGLYRIAQSGLFARPDLIGKFEEGDTLTIVSNGYDIPQAGIFRVIKEIN